jgi:hypothetical protein
MGCWQPQWGIEYNAGQIVLARRSRPAWMRMSREALHEKGEPEHKSHTDLAKTPRRILHSRAHCTISGPLGYSDAQRACSGASLRRWLSADRLC